MKKIQLPGNELILYGLAIAQTIGFAYAFFSYEGSENIFLKVLSGIRAGIFGAALSFGTAVAAQKVPRTAKRARVIGFIALGGLMIVSPVIMAPAAMAAFPAALRAILNERMQWALAISMAVAPDFVAAAVASQSGALQPLMSEPKPETSEPKPAKSEPKFACGTCKREFATQNALNAHKKSH